MKRSNTLSGNIIVTIITSAIVTVFAGHGVMPLGAFVGLAFSEYYTRMHGNLLIFVLLPCISSLFMIIGSFMLNASERAIVILISGKIFIWAGLVGLLIEVIWFLSRCETGIPIALLTSVPFFIMSGITMYRVSIFSPE